jgi:preprotein translocase subunit SecE
MKSVKSYISVILTVIFFSFDLCTINFRLEKGLDL